jgi:hypothetical protein
MELINFPGTIQDYGSYKNFEEARLEFYRKEYVGKVVEFAERVITAGGMVLHKKGDRARIVDVGSGNVKVENLDGTPIDGLFNVKAFNLVQE